MVKTKCDRLDSLEYFRKLDKWVNSWHGVTDIIKKRRLSEYWAVIDKATFSQIEINRILSSR